VLPYGLVPIPIGPASTRGRFGFKRQCLLLAARPSKPSGLEQRRFEPSPLAMEFPVVPVANSQAVRLQARRIECELILRIVTSPLLSNHAGDDW
jgi:hypothetical protein